MMEWTIISMLVAGLALLTFYLIFRVQQKDIKDQILWTLDIPEMEQISEQKLYWFYDLHTNTLNIRDEAGRDSLPPEDLIAITENQMISVFGKKKVRTFSQ